MTTQSSTSTGTYSNPITVGVFGGVGTVSGTQGSYSGPGASYQFSTLEARDAYGVVSQSGTWDDGNGGYAGDWYSGSGSYAVPAASGVAALRPQRLGRPGGLGRPLAGGAVLTGGGSYTESGADSSGYGYSDQYTLQNDGTWQASSGTGRSSAAGCTQSSYSGSGAYGYADCRRGRGRDVAGRRRRRDQLRHKHRLHAERRRRLGKHRNVVVGRRRRPDRFVPGFRRLRRQFAAPRSAATPTFDASPVPSSSGGPAASGATYLGTGTVTESAGDSSGYADNSTSTLASDGSWQPATGGGWTSSSGFTGWGFSASGTYGYAVLGGAVSGAWGQSGGANTSYNTATNYTQSGSGAPSYTGTASSGDGGGRYDSYQGSGAYAVNSSGSASGSGSTVAPAASPVPSSSGGPDASGATFAGAGTVSESAGDSSGYADNSTSPDGLRRLLAVAHRVGLGQFERLHPMGLRRGRPVRLRHRRRGRGRDVGAERRRQYQLQHRHPIHAERQRQPGLFRALRLTASPAARSPPIPAPGAMPWPPARPPTPAPTARPCKATARRRNRVRTIGATATPRRPQMSGDGTWLPATGSGAATETDATHWAYSASGGYSRPFDGGTTLQGTWQASGGSDASYAVQSPSTLNPDGSWAATGTASSSGSGSGNWAYSGSGNYAQSSSSGNAAAGSQSSFSSQATETYSQGWSSQYTVLSTLAADGAVATATTASASGSASGSHAYTSSGSSSSWTQTGNYASGSGSITQSGASSGLSVAESLQSQWQEGYTITSLPGQATTTTGGASGNSQASGVASSYSNYGGLTESAGSSGSGYSYSSGSSWSSGNTAVDHYNDQTTWSEPYTAVGQSSGSGSGSARRRRIRSGATSPTHGRAAVGGVRKAPARVPVRATAAVPVRAGPSPAVRAAAAVPVPGVMTRPYSPPASASWPTRATTARIAFRRRLGLGRGLDGHGRERAARAVGLLRPGLRLHAGGGGLGRRRGRPVRHGGHSGRAPGAGDRLGAAPAAAAAAVPSRLRMPPMAFPAA